MKKLFSIIALVLTVVFSYSQNNPKPDTTILVKAEQYFNEVKQIAANDRNTFWGIDIYGPLLLVNLTDRTIYTNHQNALNTLNPYNNIFTGVLPDTVAIANTAIEWAGVKWTMIMWQSLSLNSNQRNRLVFHELFHNVQDKLDLPMKNVIANHLDTKEGRIFFRLELEALRSSLAKPLSERKQDIQNALSFRLHRYQLFSEAKQIETTLEWNEGLAEFTGVSFSKINDKNNTYHTSILDSVTKLYPSFIRNFAYITGPVYGQLLSDIKPGWQRTISSRDNFIDLTIQAYQLQIPEDIASAVFNNFEKYKGNSIREQEEQKEKERIERINTIQKIFFQSPVLIVSYSENSTGSFSPRGMLSLDTNKMYYNVIEVIDDFGKLSVKAGAVKDFKKMQLRVALPASIDPNLKTIKTGEWELQLNDGFTLEANKEGNYCIVKQ